MLDIVNFIKDHLLIMGTIIGILAIFIYVLCAVLLNKLNKALYGKTTWMAWIPPFNIYLLGKLTIHKVFGWILLLAFLAGTTVTVELNGVSKTYSLISKDIQEPYIIVISSITLILYIYGYFKLKLYIRKNGINDIVNININNYSKLNRPFVEKNGLIGEKQNLRNNTEPLNHIDSGIPNIRLQDINGIPKDSNSVDENNNAVNSNNSENP